MITRIREPLALMRAGDGGLSVVSPQMASPSAVGLLPAVYPEWLGDRGFAETHGCRFPYVVGEMARGIATAEMVVAAAKAGLMAFFGSAGLRPETIRDNLERISRSLGPSVTHWGANLIHSPNDAGAEEAVVDLFLGQGVRRASASAFMALASSVVRYAATGLRRRPDGSIERRNHLFAKISHPGVASQFMQPPPDQILRDLVAASRLTEEEADLASRIPVAEDVTVEADSGGHTDNRALTAIVPTITRLRDELTDRHRYGRSIRIGVAGGIGTPDAVAGAFSLGAAYVLTGSVNQCAVESGLSERGRIMLAAAGVDDVAMAPAADMFEMGVKVQVLKRGTLFAARAQHLWDLYRTYPSLEAVPENDRARLEKDVFRMPVDDVWSLVKKHFASRDPAEIRRAEADLKHRMALIFCWYLFMGAQWAREGTRERQVDYQIWCGPAMGAFNAWTKGTFLERPENRSVVQIALNLLEGAAVLARAQQLRSLGVAVPAAAFSFRPRPLTI